MIHGGGHWALYNTEDASFSAAAVFAASSYSCNTNVHGGGHWLYIPQKMPPSQLPQPPSSQPPPIKHIWWGPLGLVITDTHSSSQPPPTVATHHTWWGSLGLVSLLLRSLFLQLQNNIHGGGHWALYNTHRQQRVGPFFAASSCSCNTNIHGGGQ